MRVAAKPLSASLILLAVLGCSGKPASVRLGFEFRNATDSTIWVDSVPWLSQDLSCGVLAPGGSAYLNLVFRDASVPAKTTIQWWKGTHQDRKSEVFSQELDLGSLSRSQPDDLLIFELKPDETWTARFVRNPYK